MKLAAAIIFAIAMGYAWGWHTKQDLVYEQGVKDGAYAIVEANRAARCVGCALEEAAKR